VQNHVTLDFKVIRQGHAFGGSWNELPETLNIRNKNKFVAAACVVAEIGKVTCKITWPWIKGHPSR